jgi:hypothetical protein
VGALCEQIRATLASLGSADRKTVALTIKDIEAAQGWMPGAFALAMVMHSGLEGAWADNAAAMRCDVPLAVYRASRKEQA